jgi:cytochrome c biogenesis protein CcmG/thiol:disulfide interchange protein DsbE
MRRSSLVTALLVAATLTGCAAHPAASSAARSTSAASVLQACPQQSDRPARGADLLPPVSLDCPGGGSLDLRRAPGVPTVVNLWGSWCGPCREELPIMQQFADSVAGQVRVLGVISKDGHPQSESFAKDARVTFPSAFDGQGRLMTDLGLNALPYTYFLDADGAVVYTQVGPVASVEALRGLVADHLGVHL